MSQAYPSNIKDSAWLMIYNNAKDCCISRPESKHSEECNLLRKLFSTS